VTTTVPEGLFSAEQISPIVTVTFDPTKSPPDQFDFDRPSVPMKFAGRVILKKSSPDAPWKFQGATVKDDMLHQFRPSVEPEGKVLHIFDELRDPPGGRYEYWYNVTVLSLSDNTSYTSPDPVIVNEPPP
jgi:hypothetical protein